MKLTRRSLLSGTIGGLAVAACRVPSVGREDDRAGEETLASELERLAREPVLQADLFPEPVILESLDLLRNGEEILVRARSKDGAEGLSVTNSHWLFDTHPIFLRRVAPLLLGRDMRDLETHLEDLLREDITYKLQGLALWVSVAAAEMAVLELLGRVSGKPLGDLLGGVQRGDIPVYRASGNRGNTPEEEIEFLRGLVAETGASAVKIRLGSELGENRDSAPGRTRGLIPAVREAFGDEMTLYADANSSYDAEHAIPVGRLLEEHGYAFYEEPCRFDDLWETKQVADALDIPVAGGEQEFSERRFRWTIENRVLDVVQPDLHYYGGYIRATRVARMAHAAGLVCTPHMSGWGLGYLNALHFMSFIPNPAPHLEFKGLSPIPFHCNTSPLDCVDGVMRVPSGPGFGIDLDREWVKKAEVVKSAISL
jgi:L-alanine-DL-glutamate epimerase-like enolase superfamily enzyme